MENKMPALLSALVALAILSSCQEERKPVVLEPADIVGSGQGMQMPKQVQQSPEHMIRGTWTITSVYPWSEDGLTAVVIGEPTMMRGRPAGGPMSPDRAWRIMTVGHGQGHTLSTVIPRCDDNSWRNLRQFRSDSDGKVGFRTSKAIDAQIIEDNIGFMCGREKRAGITVEGDYRKAAQAAREHVREQHIILPFHKANQIRP